MGCEEKIELFDYHVHVGQFEGKYFAPRCVIKALYKNNVLGAYISSTTSCMSWNDDEDKKLILQHIHDEIMEALLFGANFGINIVPLYWVMPSEIPDEPSLQNIFDKTPYKGFKIHPRSHYWNLNLKPIRDAMSLVCLYAHNHNFPILIHTGLDEIDSPLKFFEYFQEYYDVKFILAHCKKTNEVIDIFSKCPNVYGDTSFCSEESYTEILKAGFRNRMLYGTDFPIFHRKQKYSLPELYNSAMKNNIKFKEIT